MEPGQLSDHDLLVRIDERLTLLKSENAKDHEEIKVSVAKQDCTNRVSNLEGRLHGSWAVFGGLLTLLGFIVGLIEYLKAR